MTIQEQAIHFLEEGLLLKVTEEIIDEIDLQEQIMETERTSDTFIGFAVD